MIVTIKFVSAYYFVDPQYWGMQQLLMIPRGLWSGLSRLTFISKNVAHYDIVQFCVCSYRKVATFTLVGDGTGIQLSPTAVNWTLLWRVSQAQPKFDRVKSDTICGDNNSPKLRFFPRRERSPGQGYESVLMEIYHHLWLIVKSMLAHSYSEKQGTWTQNCRYNSYPVD